jgi:hypothetical protein
MEIMLSWSGWRRFMELDVKDGRWLRSELVEKSI